jgi:2-O-methyltransferase
VSFAALHPLLPKVVVMNFANKLRYRAVRCLNWMSDTLHRLPRPSAGAMSKEYIAQLVRKRDPMILEIGSNDGGNTLWFLELFDAAKIYCFEPEPRAIERFKQRVGDRANVTLVEMAISDQTGTTTFHRSTGQHASVSSQRLAKGWDLSGSIRKPKEHLRIHPWIKFDETITVATSTLDEWADRQNIGIIDFIWMDVQGAEKDVIRGARRTLARTRYLYTEYGSFELYEGQASLLELVRQLPDFRLVTRYRGDALFAHRSLAVASLDPPVDP